MPRMDPYQNIVGTMGLEIARLSEWFDSVNAHKDPEAVTWGRMSKLTEESGEVITNMILHTGQNPRKGQADRTEELIKENLDVALTALGNVEHLTGNLGFSMGRFVRHLSSIIERAEKAGM